MGTSKTQIGTHAGVVWKTLQEHGNLQMHHLQKITSLQANDIAAAVGWLAREDKVSEQNTTYQLGPTNLTPVIGRNAGKVWMTLRIWDDVDVDNVSMLARLTPEETAEALGWLAREGKIELKEESNTTKVLLLENE